MTLALRSRLEPLFSLSWLAGDRSTDRNEDCEDGRVEERLVQVDEHVDERQVFEVLWLYSPGSFISGPVRNVKFSCKIYF